MRKITVEEKHSNKRIDKYLKDIFPKLPFSAMQKAFRKKDIKANGIRVKQDYMVMPGDTLEIYLTDGILDGMMQADDSSHSKSFSVVYEDKNIIIVNKQQGVPVHPDKDQSKDTLIDMVKDYLSFMPSLCHRLDRNTGGLVIIAKNQESHDIILEKMETKEIKKYYQCLVKGEMEKQTAVLKAYLFKDERKSKVYVSQSKTIGAVEIVTKYKVLSYNPRHDISRLEIELLTGRTHQIRAHLASIGHPVIGDGKYGTNAVNRPLGIKYQVLWAYRLKFDFKDAGMLNYLKGKTFEIEPELPASLL